MEQKPYQRSILGTLFLACAVPLVRLFLACRYKIHIDHTKSHQLSGCLVLPNHPAEIDPVILTTLYWPRAHFRPVVLEKFYYLKPMVHTIMKLLEAFPMPDMEYDAGPQKQNRVRGTLAQVVQSLRSGSTVLLYPAGRLTMRGEERLGATTGVWSIIQEYRDVPIVLIRTRGIFGSSFSKAQTKGVTPSLFEVVKRALVTLCCNMLFFVPKRHVVVEELYNPPDFPRDGSATEINRYLENFYNSPSPEVASTVRERWYSSHQPPIALPEPRTYDCSDVPKDVERRVFEKLAKLSSNQQICFRPELHLGEDLGLDSLAIADLVLWLDKEFEATDVELAELTTVGAVLYTAYRGGAGVQERDQMVVPTIWHTTHYRDQPSLSGGEHLLEHFLKTARRMGSAPALADERSGVLTWKAVLVKTIALSRQLQKIQGDTVGVLLPASTAASLTFFAALMAQKKIVLLNWTAGRQSIEHAIVSSGLTNIITSKSFLDMVPVDLTFAADRMVYLESLVASLSLVEKVSSWVIARRSVNALLHSFALHERDSDETAVILFTSGSEALPKGVPLTHKNIIAVIQGAYERVSLDKSDVLYAFLPPFHSFGIAVGVVLPLVTGVRVVYHPNPTESKKLARGCKKWGVTLVAGTPTFLRSLLLAGEVGSFETLRLLVAGAEKVPRELHDLVAHTTQGELIEGYGITECAPVVAMGSAGASQAGVGAPLRGVNLLIVNPETYEVYRAEEQQGLILISGLNVFQGYLGGTPDPFITIDGVRYYNSGDLGYLKNGALHITGRLKRFVKIAGEMVSLGAIEEALAQVLAPKGDGAPVISIAAIGEGGTQRPTIVAVTSLEVTQDSINEILRSRGFPPLVHVGKVVRVKEVPLLGSGKLDLKQINNLARNTH
jgi:long-chain-fatty-acid--[acyl-carrier-protein] ligase